MNPELEAYQNEFIEAIPGFISIVDLNPIPVNEINSLQIITNINSANIKA
ncbi:hypothetical protein [Dolichospermum flos-aquae]|uniref:Uncharacterized protein n=1 Tax=Dolichospermum flos-aquae CCAP 1403/13F TaxID=315271 RepID=A0A6H2BTA7_DOLFA|nr:hypothetical protein [Dolichospermum flos-aquae]QJB42822.1 hypothetical protein HGD76_03125 [Dolichospermum flos-aquae CCAP 1403/13F]